MKYIIGMDGGGTKTHCVATNPDGLKLYECSGEASNFLVKGTQVVSETIFSLIYECKDSLKAEYSDIAAVVIGTTGAGRRSDAEKLKHDFIRYAESAGVKFNLFEVESDARIALEGAFSGKPGSILIAGTGSIMFGKDGSGKIHRVGGFGRYLGDEGSGFVIGRKGLVTVSKELDGRGKPTLITKLVNEKFKINSTESLINKIYRDKLDIASAAPLVLAAAEDNDEAALKIIDEESEELILHIKAMIKKIHQPVFNLSFIGGIISSENIYSKTLKLKIKEQLPGVNLKLPDFPPEMGAVLMAKELLNKGNYS